MVTSASLYAIFFLIQTMRHSHYFIESQDVVVSPASAHHHLQMRSTAYYAVMLAIYLVAVVLLADKFAIPLDNSIDVKRPVCGN